MDITGKIIAVLEARGGTSARTGNAWKVQEYVIETHEQYPKKMVFEVFGEDRIQRFNIQAGNEVTVSFDIDAHEWNGRWFNSIRAWNVVPADPNAAMAASQPAAAQPQAVQPAAQQGVQPPFPGPETSTGEGSTDDLPF